MSIIESGRIVKVEIMLKVPVTMPPAHDPRAWAMACISLNLEAAKELAAMNAFVGVVNPPPLVPS